MILPCAKNKLMQSKKPIILMYKIKDRILPQNHFYHFIKIILAFKLELLWEIIILGRVT